MSLAYFCPVTGVRVVAPGKSKLVDPVNGVEEFKPAPEKKEQKPEPQKGEDKPNKGGK